MNLNYIDVPSDLGGSAVPGCGTIHKSEIKPTLDHLTDIMWWSGDFNNSMTGSTGKREYSGDIDLVIDNALWEHGVGELRSHLEDFFNKDDIARNGNMLHLKFPISNYNETLTECLPRTGFVQIDFSVGNVKWEQFYHYSDAASAYKGAHRNLILAAITSTVNVDRFYGVDSQDIPAIEVRWKWGSNGLIQVRRERVQDPRSGQWMRKLKETHLQGPITNPSMVAKILLPIDGTEADLRSLESILTALPRNYGMTDCERIYRRAAHNFAEWNQGKLFRYPLEISRYFSVDDK
jgi:hypothetical protein